MNELCISNVTLEQRSNRFFKILHINATDLALIDNFKGQSRFLYFLIN